MTKKITTVISFKIESLFEEWAKILEIKEADLTYSEFDIYQFFRVFRKVEPKKFIFIYPAPEGDIQKFVQANNEWIKSHKVNFSIMEESNLI